MTKQTLFTAEPYQPDHEIILKLKCDAFDWVDPLVEVWIDGDTLYVENTHNTYDYKLSELADFNIREYSSENIWDYQGNYQ